MENLFFASLMAAGIWLLLIQVQTIQRGQDVTTHYMESSETLSIAKQWEPAELTVNHAELYTRMMHGIPCDVKIDGYLVESQWFNSNTFDYSVIHVGHIYRVEYSYSDDGSLKQISYKSI